MTIRPDDRFLCSREAFAAWASGRRTFRMEHFYRLMRARTGAPGEPPTGQAHMVLAYYAQPQAVPLILLFVLVGLPVASLVGTASSWPMTAALAGIVWYVHSRMMGNIREMRPAEDD